jgi:hypothetical protein
MFCPKCGAEYRVGFRECADCAVPLVESAPAPSQPRNDEVQLVTVFESGDPALIALARSLLDSAEIPFITKGDGLQDLFGWGRMPGGFNLVVGPVQFQVNQADTEEAGVLLEDLTASNQDSVEQTVSTQLQLPERESDGAEGSHDLPACGQCGEPWNPDDYRTDTDEIFCRFCRAKLVRP